MWTACSHVFPSNDQWRSLSSQIRENYASSYYYAFFDAFLTLLVGNCPQQEFRLLHGQKMSITEQLKCIVSSCKCIVFSFWYGSKFNNQHILTFYNFDIFIKKTKKSLVPDTAQSSTLKQVWSSQTLSHSFHNPRRSKFNKIKPIKNVNTDAK